MCGIMGIVGKEAKIGDSRLESMLFSLSKRGPDDKGILRFPLCTLGQTRLSILDLSGGKQPMKDNSKNIAITFNGEIYNYRGLKKELENSGHRFSTKSDTEVILKAYLKYGTDCPKFLDGMFAFALWDEDKKTLFAARDRFGEKPFFYAIDASGNFIFASEIKAILASGKIKGEVDPAALDAFLTLMYIPPNRTVYKNIQVLPPSSSLTLKNGKVKITKYWELEKKPIAISYEDAKEEVKRLLKNSVENIMVADVEIGSMLSGGVDSTLVTHLAQQYSSFPIKTFSVGYEDHINELPFALEASQKIGTDHHTMQATGNMLENLMEVSRYFDEPHADSSNFPQYLVSKLASSKVKVALTGDGADELFMGYGWYFRQWNLSWKKNPLQKLWPHPFLDYLKMAQVFTPEEKKKLWKKQSDESNYLPEEILKADSSPFQKMNDYDLFFCLPGQMLSKVDRTGMMNSLETRCPFLDRQLAEFVYNLPIEYKRDKKGGKLILKDILSEIMPKEFVYRKKQGFGGPVKQWLKDEAFKKEITELFLEKEACIYSFFNANYIRKMMRDFYKGNDSNFYKIWTLLCLELWLKTRNEDTIIV